VPSEPDSPLPLLERALGPNWRCLTDAELRADGESGPIDLVALHPRHGVVLVALLKNGETATPGEASAAFAAMLRELDIAKHHPGEIKVAALAQEMGRRDSLAEAIREAAGEASESPPDPAWMAWLMERLAPPAKPELRLVAPSPDSDEPSLPATRLQGQTEKLLLAVSQRRNMWPATLAIAALLLLAAAVLFHAGILRV
jgi:hypothetical protein